MKVCQCEEDLIYGLVNFNDNIMISERYKIFMLDELNKNSVKIFSQIFSSNGIEKFNPSKIKSLTDMLFEIFSKKN